MSHQATVSQSMECLAERAVELAAQSGYVLDFSAASVHRLEDWIHSMEVQKLDAEERKLLVSAWGAYLGECFRREIGGEWVSWLDGRGNSVALKARGLALLPVESVRKRVDQGHATPLPSYYKTLHLELQRRS
ncbi:MAG: DUF3806 domain-containing protein [Isosphaeraceae bacterium]